VVTADEPAADPGAAAADMIVRDNVVGPPTSSPGSAIVVQASNDNALCLDTAGNQAEGVGSTEHQSEDISVFQGDTATFSLERFTGDGTDDPAVEAFLLDQNPASDSADARHSTGFTGVDDGTCQSPALP